MKYKYYSRTSKNKEAMGVVEAKSKKEANKIVSENGFDCDECVGTMGGGFEEMVACYEDATEVVECKNSNDYEEVA